MINNILMDDYKGRNFKVNMNICLDCSCLEKADPNTHFNQSSCEPKYACGMHDNCTVRKGIAPYFTEDEFKKEWIPERCICRIRYYEEYVQELEKRLNK